MNAGITETEGWIERFNLWSSIRNDVEKQTQTAIFLTAGGRSLYSVIHNLTFLRSPSSVAFDGLKALLINHMVPVNSQTTERAKFHCLVFCPNMKFREFILTLWAQASKCNYGD